MVSYYWEQIATIDPIIIECFLNTDVMCLCNKIRLPEKRVYIKVYCYS